MKIEKLNENQIRCVLSRADLNDRNISMQEIKAGDEKIHRFIGEIIEQASQELGFDARGIPLIVETKSSDGEKVEFTLTKMGNREDIFKSIIAAAIREFSQSIGTDPEKYASLEDWFGSDLSSADQRAYFPYPQTVADIFSFEKLSVISDLANSVNIGSCDRSHLYKDQVTDLYYLVLEKDDPDDEAFRKLCITAGEYGVPVYLGPEAHYFFDEHMECLSRKTALEVLKQF